MHLPEPDLLLEEDNEQFKQLLISFIQMTLVRPVALQLFGITDFFQNLMKALGILFTKRLILT